MSRLFEAFAQFESKVVQAPPEPDRRPGRQVADQPLPQFQESPKAAGRAVVVDDGGIRKERMGSPIRRPCKQKRSSSVPAGGRLLLDRAGTAAILLRTAYFAWFANAHQSPIWI